MFSQSSYVLKDCATNAHQVRGTEILEYVAAVFENRIEIPMRCPQYVEWWNAPITMAIVVLHELGLYYFVETDSLIDLHQFLL